MKAKYDVFMRQEYNVESAVSKIGGQNEKMKQLEVMNTYNYMLHLVHYLPHLDQLETMRNGGEITDMSVLEACHILPPEIEIESF